ncbi:hypothetical protein BCEN4_1150021 [Burkholderia cenocepacia]|nr:hypothetical protein BCEN4_1150021 [Burkholderia cenocepacia]
MPDTQDIHKLANTICGEPGRPSAGCAVRAPCAVRPSFRCHTVDRSRSMDRIPLCIKMLRV